MWTETKKQRNFMAFTIHYIDSTWQLHCRILCTIEFLNFDEEENPVKKTAANILRTLQNKFVDLQLPDTVLSKLTFTTDQGSNIKKALAQYTRVNCIAHVLNLILTHTFKKAVLEEIAPKILQLLHSCKSLVEYLKRSGNCQKLNSTVKQECTSRWNTKFDMILSIRKNYNSIEKLLEDSKEEHRLHGVEKYLLDRLILFLQPFKTATLIFEAEKKPTIHLVLLHMHIFKEKLTILQNEETIPEVQAVIRHCLNNVFDIKYKPERIHKIAAFLWPDYKQLLYLDQNAREEVYSIVTDELNNIFEDSASASDTPNTSSESQPIESQSNTLDFSDVEDDLIKKYKDIYNKNDNNLQSKVTSEIELYKKTWGTDADNILQWWRNHEKDFPLLHQLGRKILCVPASSASSERAFSSANRVLEDRRTNLKSENVDSILFLHSAGKN